MPQELLCITNNSVKYKSFIYTQFYFKQFSISTQFSSIWPIVYMGATAKRGTLHFPKLQHYWCLTIRLFSTICWTHVGEFTPLQRCNLCILPAKLTGPNSEYWIFHCKNYQKYVINSKCNPIHIYRIHQLQEILGITPFGLQIVHPMAERCYD